VVSILQDQPADTPATPEQRTRRHGTAVRLGGAALIAVLALVAADRALDLLPSLDNPLREQVVDRSRPALMLALSDLDDYHAAQGTYQVVVDLERDVPYVPSIVKGERTTYLAAGTVDGVVDFSALGAGAVQIQGEAVTITLPAPRLGEAAVDLENSRVVSRDRGVLDRISGALSDSPTSERDVALLAEDKLQDAAASSDLLRRTQDNTRDMLTGLARSFGYSDVTVLFDAAAGT
jgi:hypothetical protein